MNDSTLPKGASAGGESPAGAADDDASEAERSVVGCSLGGAVAGTPVVASLAGLALVWLLRRRPQR